jgi:hypothetical protein
MQAPHGPRARQTDIDPSGGWNVKMPTPDQPRLLVDFNEMVDTDVVLLSREDEKIDSSGRLVALEEGMRVYLYMPDRDETGAPTTVLATGIVELNRATDWSAAVRWCCRVDRWESSEAP